MEALGRLREAVEGEVERLRAGVPGDREGAVVAVVRARDRLPVAAGVREPADPISGRRLGDPGGNLALWLCLEAEDDAPWWDESGDDGGGASPSDPSGGGALDGWAEAFLDGCGRAAEAQVVLGLGEAGLMRLAEAEDGALDAWPATRRTPASWRERADIDRWAAWLAERHPTDPVAAMAWQLPYPDDAVLGGCAVRTYRAVVGALMGLVGGPNGAAWGRGPVDEAALGAEVARAARIDVAEAGQALDALTLDRDGAAHHAAVPGVAAAPLVRLAPGRVVLSVRGLTTEPLLFLARELRRRDPEGYNNAAVLREDVFRRDLYACFRDRRFVTSAGRIQLKREDASLRTDIDAAVFDKKSGTLALFELKSLDPFARSAAELARQRDNVLYANRQVSGVLDWVRRHGAGEVLERVDRKTAKTFRAQRVLPFVLGRTLVHFDAGPAPEPDRRAAWGTWPQVLQLLDASPAIAAAANPLASLFAQLTAETPRVAAEVVGPSRSLVVGDVELTVHPSSAAFRVSGGNAG